MSDPVVSLGLVGPKVHPAIVDEFRRMLDAAEGGRVQAVALVVFDTEGCIETGIIQGDFSLLEMLGAAAHLQREVEDLFERVP